MRHKKIKSIKVRLRGDRQIVFIESETDETIILSPASIKNTTTIEINELELLIGSTVRFEFYKIGEVIFEDKVCKKENTVIKNFFFTLIKPVNMLRIENKQQLLDYKKITKIFNFNKYNREDVGIETEDKNVIFITLKRFEMLSYLTGSDQQMLLNSYILPEYYKVGDIIESGSIARTNTILKTLHFRFSDDINKMRKKYENLQECKDEDNYEHNFDEHNDHTDWTNYNDNLDMDQQGIDFWNQF